MRPIPKEMLEHPWIVSMMPQKVDMAYWMRKVWGWKNTKSHGYDRSAMPHVLSLTLLYAPISSSRPSSSRSEQPSLDSSMANLTINSSDA